MEKPVNFKVKNQQIVGMLHLPKVSGRAPAIVMCHGFSGDKVGPHPYLFVYAARYFAEAGFAVLRFDFRGSGESEGKFEDQNISSELLDLDKAIEFLAKQKEIDPGKMGLVGHSRGGAVAIIKAAGDKRIKALVTWAAPADWRDIWGNVANKIKKEGFIYFSDLKETKKLVEDDFKYNPITDWAKKIQQPWLIIHGDDDGKGKGTVPVDNAKKLFKAASLSKGKKLKIIKKANHYFFDRKLREILFSATADFLQRNLN